MGGWGEVGGECGGVLEFSTLGRIAMMRISPDGVLIVPTFDIVSRVELQEIDNAINNTKKQLAQRYDFRNVATEIDFDRKAKTIKITTADRMKMDAIRETLLNAAAKRKVEIKSFQFGDIEQAAGSTVRREVTVVEGLSQDLAKKIVKQIKDAKMKVQASIQGDEVRVTGKSIDDLQAVITMLKQADYDVPLQFVNMKR